MKIVIFAGGSGRRLWPISRTASPKQFEPIIGPRSTVQLAVERVAGAYGLENVYVSTNQRYLPIIRRQLPNLPAANLIGEPARRDLAAAVGLSIAYLRQTAGPDERVAILWGDNTMSQVEVFLRILATAEQLIERDQAKIAFVGETPRFANNNLGWIGLAEQLGENQGLPYFGFRSWIYRPPLDRCQQMFDEGGYVWNTGYCVTTVGFACQMYERHQPLMWAGLTEIAGQLGRPAYQETLNRIYPTLPSQHFDDAISKHVTPAEAIVLHGEMGWSDPGTLYALKETLNPDKQANVSRGLVRSLQSEDCLLYNYEEKKLLAAVGLTGLIVVNTEDAILVVHKDHIPLVKELVDGLVGTELESYS
ncbi:MAG: sugar phosphate nucleotidyltransferase [Chloroflexota bacterium]